jgi:hypothetical protein
MWHGDSLGTQEGERPSLEAGTRGLVRDSRPRGLIAFCSEMQTVRNSDSAIDCNCVNLRKRRCEAYSSIASVQSKTPRLCMSHHY